MPVPLFRRILSKTVFVYIPSTESIYIPAFLFSLDLFALGLFAAASIALIAHKVTIILLHGPLPTLSVIILAPFLFVFDFITLLLLHRVLASRYRARQIIGGFISLVIISCSATFVSSYLEANAELNWGRSLEVPRCSGRADIQVFSNWKIYSKLLVQGGNTSRNIFIIYIVAGCVAMLVRRFFDRNPKWNHGETSETTELRQWTLRNIPSMPLVRFTLFLVIGSMFVPAQPWRDMTSTLLFDIVGTISSVIITQNLRAM